MKLHRLYLSEAKFHYCRGLDWLAEWMFVRALAIAKRSIRIRREERIYLGPDALPLSIWRCPSVRRD